jgi:hypothetical protein
MGNFVEEFAGDRAYQKQDKPANYQQNIKINIFAIERTLYQQVHKKETDVKRSTFTAGASFLVFEKTREP